MRLTLFIIVFIIAPSLFSQTQSSEEADSLLNESFQKFAELQFIESAKLADDALKLSTIENYSKGKVMSNIYIAKVLVEVGLNMEALKYIQNINDEPHFHKGVIYQVESHRLKGKIYGSQKLYSLSKKEFEKQLSLSTKISDPKKRELSKLWAYQNIEHLYSLQEINDSIEIYQNLQEEQLWYFAEHEASYNISTLYASKGRLYMNTGRYDEAAVQFQKSIDILDKYNIPYKYYTMQLFGNLEAIRGNIDKAISCYNEALENSSSLNVANTSRDIHKMLADYLFENDTLIEKAKQHQREYTLLNDSLDYHNKMVGDAILENIIKDREADSAKRNKLFQYIVVVIILASTIIGVYLILKNRRSKNKLIKKNQQLISKTEQIGILEDKLENNIFNDIIELAKNNSPEFLPLFGEGYPEFIEAMKQLDPNIRSSELYFSALAYLNFSTKDIANFTFVTNRAVQVRRNRMRKKYNIPSEVDFNEWFRNLENGNIFRS